jgi:hypothetical protein
MNYIFDGIRDFAKAHPYQFGLGAFLTAAAVVAYNNYLIKREKIEQMKADPMHTPGLTEKRIRSAMNRAYL